MLRNATIAAVEFPISIHDNKELEELRKVLELSMMDIEPLEQEDVEVWIEGLELGIENVE